MSYILVIDDDDASRRLVCDVLTNAGYAVTAADGGEAALALARAEAPRLVITDIQMPRINGFDVLAQLRGDSDTRDVPVIAVTARAMSGDEDRILEAGFDAYLAKPLSYKSLLGLVAEQLEGG